MFIARNTFLNKKMTEKKTGGASKKVVESHHEFSF